MACPREDFGGFTAAAVDAALAPLALDVVSRVAAAWARPPPSLARVALELVGSLAAAAARVDRSPADVRPLSVLESLPLLAPLTDAAVPVFALLPAFTVTDSGNS